MQVKDVMTKEVASVLGTSPLKEVAGLMESEHVSAVPVLDHRRPIGVVSEADLLARIDHERWQPWMFWRSWHARRGRRRHALSAAGAMSAPALVIDEQATVSEAAHRMLAHGVKRLPVVDSEGRLIGIVSRGDVLKVLLRSDQAIEREIRERVLGRGMLVLPGHVQVSVTAGVVKLDGMVERRSEIDLLKRAVASVDGVLEVIASLGFRFDDTASIRGQWWELA